VKRPLGPRLGGANWGKFGNGATELMAALERTEANAAARVETAAREVPAQGNHVRHSATSMTHIITCGTQNTLLPGRDPRFLGIL
jgi:hypothetical protein